MLIAFSLILVAAGYRVLAAGTDFWPNVAPLMAIAFCGAAYLPKRWALIVPLMALLLSDIALNVFCYQVAPLDWTMLMSAACYLGATGLGFWAARDKSWTRLVSGSILSSLLFYVVTCSAAWLQNPAYVKTLAGWSQALTVGLPQYPPAWMFFRNSLISDLAFTVLFVLCMEWGRRRAESPERSATEVSAIS